MKYSKELIEKAVKSKGYLWFEKGDFNLNIVGIRNSQPGALVTNIFDDLITLSYKENGVWQYKEFAITTDPGTKAVKSYSNPKGVARLIPNQYRSMHKIRLHKGQYEALGQEKSCSVWRDKNKNMTFDEVIVDTGIFGINIHRSNPKTQSEYVENWSEGCQVFKKVLDFNIFMSISKKSADLYGNSFTYTLIESKNIF
jgi:hypothetical protein